MFPNVNLAKATGVMFPNVNITMRLKWISQNKTPQAPRPVGATLLYDQNVAVRIAQQERRN